jgi:hypothetical protein
MTDLKLRVDAGSRPGGGASQGEIRGPLKYIVRSAHRWGGNGVIPLQRKIKRVLLEKHPDVIARAFGGDADRAGAWIKDAWEKYYGHHPVGKTGSGPTYWRGKGKTVAQQLAQLDEAVEMLLADAKVPEHPHDAEPRACGSMSKGDHFKLPTYSLSLATAKGVAGVFRHLGKHPTKAGHISAKKLATGKLHTFPNSKLVIPVPRPRVISSGPVEPSPFGGMNAELPEEGVELGLRDVSTEERIALAKKGMAIPVRDENGEIVNGRFPIAHKGDLRNAISAFGRSGTGQVKAHIVKCAKKLGATSMLPDGWASA